MSGGVWTVQMAIGITQNKLLHTFSLLFPFPTPPPPSQIIQTLYDWNEDETMDEICLSIALDRYLFRQINQQKPSLIFRNILF